MEGNLKSENSSIKWYLKFSKNWQFREKVKILVKFENSPYKAKYMSVYTISALLWKYIICQVWEKFQNIGKNSKNISNYREKFQKYREIFQIIGKNSKNIR